MTTIPTPALVVLVGPSGSGKSTWARERFATGEIVSSDALRAVVGTGEHDLDASDDAFAVLDAIIAARSRRGLTTVIDTLGLDPVRRRAAVELARTSELPSVAVRFTTDAATCRQRNAARDRPVPAPALAAQLKRAAELDLEADGFDLIITADHATIIEPVHLAGSASARTEQAADPRPMRFGLQLSRFPSKVDLREWISSVARAAEEAGFDSLAVMDHLIQIPQVGRAWEPIPEAYATLGHLSAVTERIELGALVSPVTFRSAPLLAKIIATLDVMSGGRAFCGLGAGWFEREHRAYDIAFPQVAARLDELESTIGTLRAFWGSGTKSYGELPETTCYPRPLHDIPIIVGGGGERRTLDIAARLAHGCNLPSTADLAHKIDVLHQHCMRADRDPAEVMITILDLPVVGRDRDEVNRLVEVHRGGRAAATYAKAHNAGTVSDHVGRYRLLLESGVQQVFVALPDLAGPAEIERFAPVLASFAVGAAG